MDLIDMKCEPEKREKPMAICCDTDAPQYPYNMRLCLYEEQLAKLLGDAELPEIDGLVMVIGLAKVVAVSKSESEGGKVHRSLDLQIMAMKLKEGEEMAEKKPKIAPEKMLYEKS